MTAYPAWCLGVLVVISLTHNGFVTGVDEERKIHIVYMGSLPESEYYSPSAHHINLLQDVVDERFVERSLVRSYKRSFNGFAAYLTDKESEMMAARDEVSVVFPSQKRQLHTTASWDFMKFDESVSRRPGIEKETIIGVIDTGIWPESKSFDDHGFGPVPENWKGACEGGNNFTCNKKIIGARYYIADKGEEGSARDYNGHGSHTASTAAGNCVHNASFYGIGNGTARGAVPSARIAVYKVCGRKACTDDGILAAFDDAIADGVNILTISIGTFVPIDIKNDTIAIGSFHAYTKGILTVHSAGNSGGVPGLVSSVSPWLLTVAASTTTRKFVTPVVLGNGKTLNGNGINAFTLNGTQFPLVYGQASKNCSAIDEEKCLEECFDRDFVERKIVVCNTTSTLAIYEVNRTGSIVAISFLSPTQFKEIVEYINSTQAPTGKLLQTTAINDDTAPIVASFSSQGPNSYFPDILKPDITAPGVEILAAYSPAAYPTGVPPAHYFLLTGTSMSCPHVTGAAAYVKSINPSWSPSAIKSALMTTAWRMDKTNSFYGDAEFSYGAGHLNPRKAPYPGLVYETSHTDYIRWICGKNFSTQLNVTCSGVVPIADKDINYPTMAAKVGKGESFTVTFQRTVTNVGPFSSTYHSRIRKNSPLNVTVEPSILSFDERNQKKSFVVTVTDNKFHGFASASLEWFDANHNVRSPIVVFIG